MSDFSRNIGMTLNGKDESVKMTGVEWLVGNVTDAEEIQEALRAILTAMSDTDFNYEPARTLILEKEVFRRALFGFVPDDSEEREYWFTCLYMCEPEELRAIKDRIFAEFATASKEDREMCVLEGCSCLFQIEGIEAAKAVVNYISSGRAKDIVEVFDRLACLGRDAEQAVWDYIESEQGAEKRNSFANSMKNSGGWTFIRQESVDVMICCLVQDDMTAALLHFTDLSWKFSKELQPQLKSALLDLSTRLKDQDEIEAGNVARIANRMG